MKKLSSCGLVWDWNGTIVNDVFLFVEVLNVLLLKNNLPLLSSDLYREEFVFPIDEFYKKLNLYKK